VKNARKSSIFSQKHTFAAMNAHFASHVPRSSIMFALTAKVNSSFAQKELKNRYFNKNWTSFWEKMAFFGYFSSKN